MPIFTTLAAASLPELLPVQPGYAGSYGAVSLDDMYRAAMNDSYNSDAAFVQRIQHGLSEPSEYEHW